VHLNPCDPSSLVLEFKHVHEVILSICDLWEYVALDAVIEGEGVLPTRIPIYCLDAIVHQASGMRILRVEVSTLPILFWEKLEHVAERIPCEGEEAPKRQQSNDLWLLKWALQRDAESLWSKLNSNILCINLLLL
jgi:hypothetical protein